MPLSINAQIPVPLISDVPLTVDFLGIVNTISISILNKTVSFSCAFYSYVKENNEIVYERLRVVDSVDEYGTETVHYETTNRPLVKIIAVKDYLIPPETYELLFNKQASNSIGETIEKELVDFVKNKEGILNDNGIINLETLSLS